METDEVEIEREEEEVSEEVSFICFFYFHLFGFRKSWWLHWYLNLILKTIYFNLNNKLI
jgi:hypothetical protein